MKAGQAGNIGCIYMKVTCGHTDQKDISEDTQGGLLQTCWAVVGRGLKKAKKQVDEDAQDLQWNKIMKNRNTNHIK